METGYPGTQYYIKDILVVGAADALTGDRWSTSGTNLECGIPHVYGPGDNVIRVDGDKAHWESSDHGTAYKVTEGTSVGKFSTFESRLGTRESAVC